MISRYMPEIRRAALSAGKPGDTLISRRRIEDEINEHPDQYPGLSGRCRIGQRRIITLAMNGMYPGWSRKDGVRPSSLVWDISDESNEDLEEEKP
ncbi:MAG: hypothetical protein GX268_03205 [Methanomicrobiales archaeon]|jgi:hypothetical protein|nr:hypothetical protein [Methanomicrobiales archaeon]